MEEIQRNSTTIWLKGATKRFVGNKIREGLPKPITATNLKIKVNAPLDLCESLLKDIYVEGEKANHMGTNTVNHQNLATRARTTIRVDVLREWAKTYPDKAAGQFLVDSFNCGFWFRYRCPKINTSGRILKSARLKPQIVAEKLASKDVLGRIEGPDQTGFFPTIHINPLCLVPK